MEKHIKIGNLPTAKEFLETDKDWNRTTAQMMIEFAKLHVEAALKEAEKETVKHISKTILELNMYNKNSILKSYPLENIK